MDRPTGGGAPDQWIRRFHQGRRGPARLVCLPHAGGSAGSFHALSELLQGEVEVLAVQYPGRQNRRSEPLVGDVARLGAAVAGALRPWRDEPLVLFGHSLGAAVAFEATRRMDTQPGPPTTLVASARRAPSEGHPEQLHTLSDAGLIAALEAMGGLDDAVRGHSELLNLVLPVLRSDFRAGETYRVPVTTAVNGPVVVFVGDQDPSVSVAQAERWCLHTTGPFALHVFTGGHFYLHDEPAAVAARLLEVVHGGGRQG